MRELHEGTASIVIEETLTFRVAEREGEVTKIDATYAVGTIPEPGDPTVMTETVRKIRTAHISEKDQHVEIPSGE